jgi:hypothetical protein
MNETRYTCPICHKSVDLERDRYADENGQIMHETCYLQQLMSSRQDPPAPQHTE